MKLLIGINGPTGIGKTWLADEIETATRTLYADLLVKRYAIRDLIWAEFKEQHCITESYDDFKSNTPDARQQLIEHAESRRRWRLDYWDWHYNNMVRSLQTHIIVNDSVRMQTEWNSAIWSSRRLCLLINIGPVWTQVPGRRFEGDSGRRVGTPYISAEDSNEAFAEFQEYLLDYLGQFAR